MLGRKCRNRPGTTPNRFWNLFTPMSVDPFGSNHLVDVATLLPSSTTTREEYGFTFSATKVKCCRSSNTLSIKSKLLQDGESRHFVPTMEESICPESSLTIGLQRELQENWFHLTRPSETVWRNARIGPSLTSQDVSYLTKSYPAIYGEKR